MVEIVKKADLDNWKSETNTCDLCSSQLHVSFEDLKGEGIIIEKTQGGNSHDQHKVQYVEFWYACPVCDTKLKIEIPVATYKRLRAWRHMKQQQEIKDRSKAIAYYEK